MEELITLNQLKAYDDEKTNIWHNNFTTNNLTVNNASFGSINANGELGNNGQVLGKNNGVLEWMNVSGGGSVDTDNLIVNNITINNSATVNGDVFTHKGFDVASTKLIMEDNYNNLGAEARNDAFYITGPNGNMYFMGMKWTPSYVPIYPDSYVAYVDLPKMAYNQYSMTISTLTFTSDAVTNRFVNGGKYNGIYKKTPFEASLDVSAPIGTQANTGSIITNANELYIVDASNMYYNCRNLTDTFISNPSLITNSPKGYNPMRYCTNMANTFNRCSSFNQPVNIPDSVTNMASTFYGCGNFNQLVNIPDNVMDMDNTFYYCYNFNQPVNIPNSVRYMSNTFYHCSNFNQPVNIPNSVTRLYGTFSDCYNFNQPVNIPDSVREIPDTFHYCSNFNQPVNIPNSVTNMDNTFYHCSNFNQPVNIPNSVTVMYGTFNNCTSFNQPVNIPNSVISMSSTFSGCSNFNQPVSIPNSVTDMFYTFLGCTTLASSTVPIHISSSIALGDTSNYIYNCLVNNYTGIAFDPSRILNDL